jgi:hypothetical protein
MLEQGLTKMALGATTTEVESDTAIDVRTTDAAMSDRDEGSAGRSLLEGGR